MNEELDQELETVAGEITLSEQRKQKMMEQLKKNITSGEDGIDIFKAEDLDACQDFLWYCEFSKNQDIRLEYNGKVYSKEQVTPEFLREEVEEFKESEGKKPVEDTRKSIENKLSLSMKTKSDLSQELQDLEVEYADLENQCQETGRVLPSDEKQSDLDQEEEK